MKLRDKEYSGGDILFFKVDGKETEVISTKEQIIFLDDISQEAKDKISKYINEEWRK